MMRRLWWQSKCTNRPRDLRFTLSDLCRRLGHDSYVLRIGCWKGRAAMVSAVGRST